MTRASNFVFERTCGLLIECLEKENQALKAYDHEFISKNLEHKKTLMETLHLAMNDVVNEGCFDVSLLKRCTTSLSEVMFNNQQLLGYSVSVQKCLATTIKKAHQAPKTYTCSGSLHHVRSPLLRCGV